MSPGSTTAASTFTHHGQPRPGAEWRIECQPESHDLSFTLLDIVLRLSSLLLLGGARARRGFQDVCVIAGIDDLSLFHLPTDFSVAHPVVLQNLLHFCSLLRVYLEHPANDMAAFPRQQPQNSPRASDYLLFLARRRRRRCFARWLLFAMRGLVAIVTSLPLVLRVCREHISLRHIVQCTF